MPYSYEGSELALFAKAINWKSYFRSRISRFISGQVLEVGAGIGGTTRLLVNDTVSRWVCLEPDEVMTSVLTSDIAAGHLPEKCTVIKGKLPSPLITERTYNTMCYIDVLEHIEKDGAELEQAVRYLDENGYLIVLSPAHNWLFSPFDDAVGHFRRYNRKMLTALTPKSTRLVTIEYLDAVGLFASLMNRLFLRQSDPTPGQIAFWDKVLVPASRSIDPLFGRRFGKSIIAVWQKLPSSSLCPPL